MALKIYSSIKPDGSFPVADAEDIAMPDGTRLNEYLLTHNGGSLKELEGIPEIEPDKFYNFGEVSSLDLNLIELNDGNVHEYLFEFIPKEDFTELHITPKINWVTSPICIPGQICQVSIVRKVGVMIRAKA